MVYLLHEQAVKINTREFIGKYGINGLSGFQCNRKYENGGIALGNIIYSNPSFVKEMMEHGWDPTLCILEDGDYSDFDTLSTRFELYRSIYMSCSYPSLNGLFMRYFSFANTDISDDLHSIKTYCKYGEEHIFNDLVDRLKIKKGFEFLIDREDPRFSKKVWKKLNPTKVNASIKIQSFVRMIMCMKKVQLMRYEPDVLFDKTFGNMRRNILQVKESNWF